MDKYFINYLRTYAPKNKKCKLISDFISQFEYHLISDNEDLISFFSDIRKEVEGINEKHPKIKKLIVNQSKNYIGVKMEGSLDDDVCSLHIVNIKGRYKK